MVRRQQTLTHSYESDDIECISVSDSSIQFRLSDSSLVSKIKDLDYVKGKVIQVLVIVATPQGYNKDTFVFNVQF
jgi:hypothetical protein